jgi:calcium-dependent protein kinase
MGCPCSHEEEPPLLNDKNRNPPYDRPYAGGLKMTNLKTGPASLANSRQASTDSAKDLNIVYTDLIGVGSGRLRDNYTIQGGPVGEGAYGQVRKAVHKKTGVERAIKIISKRKTDKKAQEWLINEVAILKQLDHPNIMKVHEFFEDTKYFYIVTDFYDGGELFDKISSMKYFTEKFAASTVRQILSAIAYCHSHKIVHRDLKPENILYESKKTGAGIKVIDFGTSNLYDPKTVMNERFGTPYYIAPEVLNGNYTEKCDMWSIGVILYVLLCGFPPFDGENEKEIFAKVLRGQYSFDEPEWKSVSDEAKNLIKRLLDMNPDKRYSAEEALKDPWFDHVIEEPDEL